MTQRLAALALLPILLSSQQALADEEHSYEAAGYFLPAAVADFNVRLEDGSLLKVIVEVLGGPRIAGQAAADSVSVRVLTCGSLCTQIDATTSELSQSGRDLILTAQTPEGPVDLAWHRYARGIRSEIDWVSWTPCHETGEPSWRAEVHADLTSPSVEDIGGIALAGVSGNILGMPVPEAWKDGVGGYVAHGGVGQTSLRWRNSTCE